MKNNKDELLRYLWGCLTIAANDYAESMEDADEETLATLLPAFDKLAAAQQEVELAYFRLAKDPDITARRDAAYMPVPEDLESEVRAAMKVLLASKDSETVFDAAAAELKAFVALVNQNNSFGAGAVGVARRIQQRSKRMQELIRETKGSKPRDYLSPLQIEQLREEVRLEQDAKMLEYAAKIRDLKELIRAKRAQS